MEVLIPFNRLAVLGKALAKEAPSLVNPSLSTLVKPPRINLTLPNRPAAIPTPNPISAPPIAAINPPAAWPKPSNLMFSALGIVLSNIPSR